MDCTYKTKAYRMPLCIVSGVTLLNTTFWKGKVDEDKIDNNDVDKDKGSDKVGKTQQSQELEYQEKMKNDTVDNEKLEGGRGRGSEKERAMPAGWTQGLGAHAKLS